MKAINKMLSAVALLGSGLLFRLLYRPDRKCIIAVSVKIIFITIKEK